MRPTYETAEDRKREWEVANRLAELWKCSVKKNPSYYPIDFSMCRDGKAVKAFVEIKCRGKKYPTLLLSLHKWQAALDATRVTGKPVFVVASVPDGLYYMRAEERPVEIEMGGRVDRDDPDDIEPCVMLPYAWMTKL